MYFGRATRCPPRKKVGIQYKTSGISIIFTTLNNEVIMHYFNLTKGCSNNEDKYETLIAALDLSLALPIEQLIVYGDFELVIKINEWALQYQKAKSHTILSKG